jgi:hypothetical protein
LFDIKGVLLDTIRQAPKPKHSFYLNN